MSKFQPGNWVKRGNKDAPVKVIYAEPDSTGRIVVHAEGADVYYLIIEEQYELLTGTEFGVPTHTSCGLALDNARRIDGQTSTDVALRLRLDKLENRMEAADGHRHNHHIRINGVADRLDAAVRTQTEHDEWIDKVRQA